MQALATVGNVEVIAGMRARERRLSRLGNGVEVLGDVGLCGDVDILGALEPFRAPRLPRKGEIGWQWDHVTNELCAYLKTEHTTVRVRIPLARVRAAVKAAMAEVDARMMRVPDNGPPTVSGFFSFVKKAVKSVAKAVTPKPLRKIARFAARKLAPIVKKAGAFALKVARSKPFAAAMGAMAIAPPFNAIGAAGLAAYKAANTAKRVLDTANNVRRGVAGVGRAAQMATRNPTGAIALAARYASNARLIPNTPQGRMLTAALKSVPTGYGPLPVRRARPGLSAARTAALARARAAALARARQAALMRARARRAALARAHAQRMAALARARGQGFGMPRYR